MSEYPPVIPLIQSSFDKEGNPISRRVRPITYALLSFVKKGLGLRDSINISEDEKRSQWQFELPIDANESDGNELVCFLDADEEAEILTIDIYIGSFELNGEELDKVKNKILEFNSRIIFGCFQLLNGETIRYHSGIDFNGIASKDPEYSGPHLIQPKLIANMLERALSASRAFVAELGSLSESQAEESDNRSIYISGSYIWVQYGSVPEDTEKKFIDEGITESEMKNFLDDGFVGPTQGDVIRGNKTIHSLPSIEVKTTTISGKPADNWIVVKEVFGSSTFSFSDPYGEEKDFESEKIGFVPEDDFIRGRNYSYYKANIGDHELSMDHLEWTRSIRRDFYTIAFW